MNKRYLIWIIIAVILGIFIYSQHFFYSKKNNNSIPTVTVVPVVQKNISIETTVIGNVQAYSSVNVRSRVDGQLLTIGFREGDTVEANQLLFKIDPASYEIALQQAEANVAKDLSALRTAELAMQRNTSLAKKGYVAKQEFDTLQNNVTSLAATVKSSNALLENAKLQLSYTNIYAPISGRTGNVLVKPGNLVHANDTNPLVVINQVKPIYVSFNLPEEKLAGIRRNISQRTITVLASANKDSDNFILSGTLTFIDNSVDTTTGTIQLKASFANENLQLWPGQFVRIKVPLEKINNAILVPTQAIQIGPNGSYVFILDKDNKVKMQTVIPGAIVNGDTVVESGLNPHAKVVTEGFMQLTNGALVNPVVEPHS